MRAKPALDFPIEYSRLGLFHAGNVGGFLRNRVDVTRYKFSDKEISQKKGDFGFIRPGNTIIFCNQRLIYLIIFFFCLVNKVVCTLYRCTAYIAFFNVRYNIRNHIFISDGKRKIEVFHFIEILQLIGCKHRKCAAKLIKQPAEPDDFILDFLIRHDVCVGWRPAVKINERIARYHTLLLNLKFC